MPRPLRIEFAGAVHHVMAQDNQGQPIFRDDQDPQRFLETLVEACVNLASPNWLPLQTVKLTNGSFQFSDPQWTNYPSRFYSLAMP